jgi:hypothetical protein
MEILIGMVYKKITAMLICLLKEYNILNRKQCIKVETMSPKRNYLFPILVYFYQLTFTILSSVAIITSTQRLDLL